MKIPTYGNVSNTTGTYGHGFNTALSRTFFRVRSSTIPLKMNLKSDKKFAAELWKCDFCLSLNPETNNHVIWCPAYASLPEGLSLENYEDDAKYFMSVLRFREEEAEKRMMNDKMEFITLLQTGDFCAQMGF